MATLQAQVEGLTSLSVGTTPTTAELAEFLKDGVIDVTNRWLLVRPQDIDSFTRESAEQTSNGFNPGTNKIVSVIRESGDDGKWYPCSKKHINLQYLVTDGDSLNYASKYNPVYMITQNRNVHVYPAPSGAGNNGFKVLYVNSSPEELDGTVLDQSSTAIKWFPEDKVYLVVLYAGMKVLQAKMGDSIISISVSVPVTPSSPSFTYTDASVSDIVKPLVSISDMAALTENAPTYIAPVVSLTSFPSLDWDMPAIPVLPSINAESSSTGGAEVDTAKLTTAPSYTPPVMNTPDFSDANTWISTEEDSEMLASRVQMIQAQIAEYQAKLAESQAKFSEENAEYQANLQIAMQDASQANTGDSTKIQKFSGQVSMYSAEIGSIIQSNQGEISAWQQENALTLQKHSPDIQSALNNFNKENVLYQQDIQRKGQNFQKNIQEAIKNIDNEIKINSSNLTKNVQISLQNAVQDFQQDVQEYGSSLQRYTAEIQAYSAEVQKEVQEQNAKIQQYQLLYNQLKSDYDGAYAIMAPRQQAAQGAA
tara:strand:+ start:907 stop:2514 length:1608 start_codon:yes stop_codon:yes gene_type:complete